MRSSYTPEAISLMGLIYDEAYVALRNTTSFPTLNEEYEVRHRMATRVLEEVSNGELDPIRLRAVAMSAIEA